MATEINIVVIESKPYPRLAAVYGDLGFNRMAIVLREIAMERPELMVPGEEGEWRLPAPIAFFEQVLLRAEPEILGDLAQWTEAQTAAEDHPEYAFWLHVNW